MPRLKVRFDELDHGRVYFFLFNDGELVVKCDFIHIYDSFAPLVATLLALEDGSNEDRLVVWLEAPAELEMHFTRQADVVRLEIKSFPDSSRPPEKSRPDFVFIGTYDEICLPFWRALRSLEGRYTPEELTIRWKGYFPHRELGLLTELLGKGSAPV